MIYIRALVQVFLRKWSCQGGGFGVNCSVNFLSWKSDILTLFANFGRDLQDYPVIVPRKTGFTGLSCYRAKKDCRGLL
jgi:hypothetical protein